jgi:hypothetical protein
MYYYRSESVNVFKKYVSLIEGKQILNNFRLCMKLDNTIRNGYVILENVRVYLPFLRSYFIYGFGNLSKHNSCVNVDFFINELTKTISVWIVHPIYENKILFSVENFPVDKLSLNVSSFSDNNSTKKVSLVLNSNYVKDYPDCIVCKKPYKQTISNSALLAAAAAQVKAAAVEAATNYTSNSADFQIFTSVEEKKYDELLEINNCVYLDTFSSPRLSMLSGSPTPNNSPTSDSFVKKKIDRNKLDLEDSFYLPRLSIDSMSF